MTAGETCHETSAHSCFTTSDASSASTCASPQSRDCRGARSNIHVWRNPEQCHVVPCQDVMFSRNEHDKCIPPAHGRSLAQNTHPEVSLWSGSSNNMESSPRWVRSGPVMYILCFFFGGIPASCAQTPPPQLSGSRSCGDAPPWRVRPGRRAVGRNSRPPQVGPGTPC